MNRRPGALYTVSSPADLAKAVGTLVAKCGGSEVTTAKAIGISQSTLNRLRNRAIARISHDTAAALERAANDLSGRGLADQINRSILSPSVFGIVHDAYRQWCDERASRFERRYGQTWMIEENGKTATALTYEESEAARATVVQSVWRIAHEEFPEQFARLERTMRRRHVEEGRARVATLRVFEPLCESADSGYVERLWTELTPAERRSFIDAGIKREIIMLNREPAMGRARRVTGGAVSKSTKKFKVRTPSFVI